MKKTIAVALSTLFMGLMLASGLAMADHHECKKDWGKKREAYAEKKLEKMTKKLNLSKEQQDQIKSLMAGKMEKMDKVKEEMHAKMEAIHSEHMAAVNAVLNDDQKKKFSEWHDAKKKDCCKDCDGDKRSSRDKKE